MTLPDWWHWELEFSYHCEKRMIQRGISEIQIREVLTHAMEFIRQDHDTYLIPVDFQNQCWRIIVMPLEESQTIFVVTVYIKGE